MRFVRFSYFKTANRTTPCGVVRCGVVIPFCGRFWCGFCGFCGLVNTPSNNQNHKCNVLYGNIYLDNINKKNNNYHFWSARA